MCGGFYMCIGVKYHALMGVQFVLISTVNMGVGASGSISFMQYDLIVLQSLHQG